MKNISKHHKKHIHGVKYWNFTWFPGVERYSFRIVSGEPPETLQKLCLSTKFPHKKIRWNYGILRSDLFRNLVPIYFKAFKESIEINGNTETNWIHTDLTFACLSSFLILFSELHNLLSLVVQYLCEMFSKSIKDF